VTFDPTKPAQTRDGRAARIICVDRDGIHPIVALVRERASGESVRHYAADGMRATAISLPDRTLGDDDLVNIPRKHKRWLYVFQDGSGTIFPKFFEPRELADAVSAKTYAHLALISRTEIEITEGEGLFE
jgi:hypothetical protein